MFKAMILLILIGMIAMPCLAMKPTNQDIIGDQENLSLGTVANNAINRPSDLAIANNKAIGDLSMQQVNANYSPTIQRGEDLTFHKIGRMEMKYVTRIGEPEGEYPNELFPVHWSDHSVTKESRRELDRIIPSRNSGRARRFEAMKRRALAHRPKSNE